MHVQSIRNRKSSHNGLSKGLTPNNRLSQTLSCSKNAVFVFLAIAVFVPVSVTLFLILRSSKLERRAFRVVKQHVIASPQNWGRKFWNQNWKMKAASSPFRSEFKIFVYDLPPKFNKDLLERNFNYINEQLDSSQIDCLSSFYSAECWIHKWINYSSYRTHDPAEADFFFVPVYPVCRRHLQHGFTAEENLKTTKYLWESLTYIKTNFPYWNKHSGKDHIWTFTQGLGPEFFGDPGWSDIQDSIFFVSNGDVEKPWFHKRTIVIPPFAHLKCFHQGLPRVSFEKRQKTLFAGTVHHRWRMGNRVYSGGIRQFLFRKFAHLPEFNFHEGFYDNYCKDLFQSKFCLCPPGWWKWSPRLVEAILAGCIPVILTSSLSHPFESKLDFEKLALFVNKSQIHQLRGILNNCTDTNVIKKQLYASETRHLFYFDIINPYQNTNAFYMLMNMLQPLRKVEVENTV